MNLYKAEFKILEVGAKLASAEENPEGSKNRQEFRRKM